MSAPLPAAALLLAWLAAADAATAAPICAADATSDRLLPLAPSLVEQTKQVFGLAMPDDLVLRTTLMRCDAGSVMMCNEGANLPCGKANVSRSLPGASAYCHDHPQASVVPAFATGHDTIYAWRCEAGQARADRQILDVDKQGFIAQFWKRLP